MNRAACLFVLLGTAALVPADAATFRVIARTGDPKPEAGQFLHFSPPIFDGVTIGFRDDDAAEFYKAETGPPVLVAKLTQPAPGFDSNYLWFDHYNYYSALRPCRHGIPYHGQASKVGLGVLHSIFSDIDQPNNLAPEFLQAPDGGFIRMYGYGFASDDRNVLFSGGTTVSGIYQGLYCVLSGVVKFVADSRTVVPALGITMDNITSTGDIRGEFAIGKVSAHPAGQPAWNAILRYRLSNGGIDYPVTTDDLLAVAGETSHEIAFWPSLSETGRIVFHITGYSAALNRYVRAVYMWQDDFLTKIADPSTPLPQGVGNFLYDNMNGESMVLSTSRDRIAFTYTLHSVLGDQAIYLWNAGNLIRVAAPGDTIGDKSIAFIEATRSMLAGHSVAFKARFTDGTQAVVLANTCAADLNGDDQVDDADFVIFASAYNLLLCDDAAMPANCPADLDGDTYVDDSDFVLFVAAYNQLLCP